MKLFKKTEFFDCLAREVTSFTTYALVNYH